MGNQTISADTGFLRLVRPLPVWLLIACGTLSISVAGLAVHGLNENGLRLASQLAWRFTMLVYLLAIVAGPLGRLVSFPGLRTLYRERRQLLWGFLASFGVFLASVLVPNTFPLPASHGGLTGGMLFFIVFGVGLTSVTAYAAGAGAALQVGEPARRAMLGVGLCYFWLAYALSSLSHLSDQNTFYALSLALLVMALLLRLGDRFVARLRKR